MSHSNIYRYLKDKYEYREVDESKVLTEDHKKARVQWCQRFLKYYWENLIFTEEVIFRCSKFQKLWTMKGNAPKPLNKKVKSKINAWGVISKNGRSKLETFNQNMDSAYYINILNINLKELKKMSGGWNIKLVSGNGPKHTSADSVSFYKLNKINRLDWSLYYPDLNQIENVCGIIKPAL